MAEPTPAASTFICPQCQAAYRLPPGRQPAPGKKLKCASCGHIWVPVPRAEQAAPVAEAAPPPPPPTPEESAAPVADPSPTPAAAPPEAEAPAAEAPAAEAEPVAAATDTPLAAPALEALARPVWWGWLAGEQRWLFVALVLAGLGLVGAGVAVYEQLHEPAAPPPPGDLPLATADPLQVVVPPLNLLLVDVTGTRVAQPLAEGGDRVELTVHGTLVNAGPTALEIPALRLELLDGEGQLMDFALIQPVAQLPSGGRAPFRISLTDPVGEQWQVNWVE